MVRRTESSGARVRGLTHPNTMVRMGNFGSFGLGGRFGTFNNLFTDIFPNSFPFGHCRGPLTIAANSRGVIPNLDLHVTNRTSIQSTRPSASGFSGIFPKIRGFPLQFVGPWPWKLSRNDIVQPVPPGSERLIGLNKTRGVCHGIVFPRVNRNVTMTMDVFQMDAFQIRTASIAT